MSVDDLIDQLGGPSAVATALGVRPHAVSMMKSRATIPPRHHMALWRLAKDVGIDWAPPGAPDEPAARKPTPSSAEVM